MQTRKLLDSPERRVARQQQRESQDELAARSSRVAQIPAARRVAQVLVRLSPDAAEQCASLTAPEAVERSVWAAEQQLVRAWPQPARLGPQAQPPQAQAASAAEQQPLLFAG